MSGHSEETSTIHQQHPKQMHFGLLLLLSLVFFVLPSVVDQTSSWMDPSQGFSREIRDVLLIGVVWCAFLLPWGLLIFVLYRWRKWKRFRTHWALAPLILVWIAWIVPAPLSGYWHTPLTDCLCDSKNLLSFQEGRAYRWASGHGMAKEPYGTYKRGVYWGEWDTGEDVVKIRPGWFFIRIKMPEQAQYIGGKTYYGFREWRPGYIAAVLETKSRPILNEEAP